MKKHVSLLLALLMVFSVVLATSAEAASNKQTVVEQTQAPACMLNGSGELEAPRATDLGQYGDAIMYIPGDNTCAHTFKITAWNYSQHKKYCTKCGYTVFYNHSGFRLITATDTKHYIHCAVCGDSCQSHVWRCYNVGNPDQHVKKCIYCGYQYYTMLSHVWIVKNGVTQCKDCGYRLN